MRLLFFLWFFAIATFLSAADYKIDSLELGTDASQIALGSSIFSNSPNGFLINDATILKSNKSLRIGTFFGQTMGDYNFHILSIANQMGPYTLAVAGNVSGTDGIVKTTTQGFDNEFVKTGKTYGFTRQHAKLAINRSIGTATVGIGVHYYAVKLDSYSYNTTDYSVGISLPIKTTTASLSAINLVGNSVHNDKLPLTLLLGLKKQIFKGCTLIVAGKQVSGTESIFLSHYGVAYELNKHLSLNAGLGDQLKGKKKGSTHRLGADLKLFGLGLSYAYKHSDYSDQQHYFSAHFNL